MTDAKIVVLGAGGMLGNAMLRVISERPEFEVVGTVRSPESANALAGKHKGRLITHFDAENSDALVAMLGDERPSIIINCIGLIKQRQDVDDPLVTLPINAMLPHRLAQMAELVGARVIHFSTDCVFSGSKGDYRETDFSDAYDLYGRSKYLGELHAPHCVTVRTSIIGHELGSSRSLIGWFLSQRGQTKGFRRAIFSGLPTVELAHIVRDRIIPDTSLQGLRHVSAQPINKYELLKIVADVYGKEIDIVPDDALIIDRSLNSDRFRNETGYEPPDWPELVRAMYEFQ